MAHDRHVKGGGGAKITNVSSPYSSGGGGVTFEHLVAATYLGAMLCGDGADVFGRGRQLVEVAFQQSPETLIDDLVLTAQTGEDDRDRLRIDVAIRRAPKFVTSDTKTAKLVGDFVGEVLRMEDDDAQVLALVVAGAQPHAGQVAALADLARGQVTAESFYRLVETEGRFSAQLRDRLKHVSSLVAEACTTEARALVSSRGGDREVTWRMLKRMKVLWPRLESPDRTDWDGLIQRLQILYPGPELASAESLADRLAMIAAESGPKAAVIDRASLGRLVHPLVPVSSVRHARGWQLLEQLDRDARAAVRSELPQGSSGSARTVLDRERLASRLRGLVSTSDVVVVHGGSGVGKSALAMRLGRPVGTDSNADEQFIAVNLRQLPPSPATLAGSFGSPLAALFRDLTAPVRGVLIDAAEAVAEGWADVLGHIVRAAIESQIRVVVITADENRALVESALSTSGISAMAHFEVPSLDDAEVDHLVEQHPRLAKLASDPRSRRLLERLVTVDLLLRSGTAIDAVPYSEVDVLRVVWAGLVRRNETIERGHPDAREHVLLRLARAQLEGADAAEVSGALDAAALSGLRRDGLLRPASINVWVELPEFSHDEIRRFAVARALASAPSISSVLTTAGHPRWSLPAARLACQALLEAPSTPTNPLDDRLAKLQGDFDSSVASGTPARWGDVPVEALLDINDSEALLRAAWDEFAGASADGLHRLCRVISNRHNMSLPTPFVLADAIVERLTRESGAWDDKQVFEVLRGWLRALVITDAPQGHPLRMRLSSQLVTACDVAVTRAAEHERIQEQERIERLARRTPDEVARDEKRRAEREASFPLLELGYPRDDDGPLRRQLPSIWRSKRVLELFALLGPDLGSEGARVIEASAADSPDDAAPLVESPLVGRSLASFDPDLLLRLTQAYYLDDGPSHYSMLEDGVRDHTYGGLGMPQAARWRGPFLPLFQTRFVDGAAMLNRILDHAARIQVSDRFGDPFDLLGDETEPAKGVELALGGQSRIFVGDARTWGWYRGTTVGPYAAVSALQALEQVADFHIERGASVEQVVQILLTGCSNLAMLGLVVGIMVRHAEANIDWLDDYLAEPVIWRLEFGRSRSELLDFRLNRDDEVHNDERRRWSLRETGMWLCIHSTGDRLDALEQVGRRLVARAEHENGSDPDEIEITTAKGWASMLDRSNYSVEQRDGQIVVSAQPPHDVTSELASRQQELQPFHLSVELGNKYAMRPFGVATEHQHSIAEIEQDLGRARELLGRLSAEEGITLEGPAAIAGAAIRAVILDGKHLEPGLAEVVVTIVREVLGSIPVSDDPDFEGSMFDMGADRSIARALPLLLLPEAAETFLPHIDADLESARAQVEAACMRLIRAPDLEVRLHFARGLDWLWPAPCRGEACHHEAALRILDEMPRNCVMGSWDQARQRRVSQRLEGPLVPALAAAEDKNIRLGRLTGPIRALGAAAVSLACVRGEAEGLLEAMIDAQRRALAAHESDHDDRGTHAMAVARALLQGCSEGRESALFAHVEALPLRGRHRATFLRALAAVAEETPELATTASRVWPGLIERGIVLVDADPVDPTRDERFDTPLLAALMPRRGELGNYLYREIAGETQDWIHPEDWGSVMEHWLQRATGDPDCVDSLIGAMVHWDVGRQTTIGLPWIHRLTIEHIETMVARSWILGSFLLDVRMEAQRSDASEQMWQTLVDAIVVAGGDSRLAQYS